MSMDLIRAFVVASALFFTLVTCDINADKQRCASTLVGAATCLPYVSGEAKAPPPDCCTGFNQIVANSPDCICLLVKDRDDPSLNLKINATLALGLPERCRSPANLTVSDCPRLLHLSPDSPDAKVFQDFANGTATSAAGPSSGVNAAATPNGSPTGDGGKKITCLWGQVLVAMVAALLNLCH